MRIYFKWVIISVEIYSASFPLFLESEFAADLIFPINDILDISGAAGQLETQTLTGVGDLHVSEILLVNTTCAGVVSRCSGSSLYFLGDVKLTADLHSKSCSLLSMAFNQIIGSGTSNQCKKSNEDLHDSVDVS